MLWSPSSFIGTTRIPGVSIGTTNMEIPLCFATLGSVRVASQTKSASPARLVKIFEPLMTYSSPSRTARVVSEARSVPELGSV